MCGRFVQIADPDLYADYFGVLDPPALAPRYNLAPTDPVAVVRRDEAGDRRLVTMRWGLVPAWAKDSGIGARLFNARAETCADKPAFRAAFRRRRCVVPADGFYEWTAAGAGARQPWYLHGGDGAPLALAGLWEQWRGADPPGRLLSCTILTMEARGAARALHPRMPVILDPDDLGEWLDPAGAAAGVLARRLAAGPPRSLATYPVDRAVNDARNDGAALVRPAAADPE